ncbi:MAG: hypothetical protein IPK16_04820 [Anaerolineales bacterium]|nr:hypothetical protein [Anaerolineales bacterium]
MERRAAWRKNAILETRNSGARISQQHTKTVVSTFCEAVIPDCVFKKEITLCVCFISAITHSIAWPSIDYPEDVYYVRAHGTIVAAPARGTEVCLLARDIPTNETPNRAALVGVTAVIAPDADEVVTVYPCEDMRHADRRCRCYETRIPRKKFTY